MKKLIFVLTYNEGPEWIVHYSDPFMTEFQKNNFLFIIVDNGNQDNLKEWCEQYEQLYFRTENNLGSTGGYNLFIRIGELLKSRRIGVIQADVLVKNPLLFEFLFFKPFDRNLVPEASFHYKDDEFVYFPNMTSDYWSPKGIDWDVGQFFSLNPWFFIKNEYLCDENYTVTHFESIDLFVRMTSDANHCPAVPINIFYHYFNKDDNNKLKLYETTHKTNFQGLHDKWFEYNVMYWKEKWNVDDTTSTVEDFFNLFKRHELKWARYPWSSDPDNFYKQLMLHKKPLRTERNTNVGQVPYPVEHECNRFYKEFVQTEILERGTYY